MRELTNVTRTKKTLQLSFAEFFEGSWLKQIPKTNKVEIKYTANNGILIIKDMPYVKSVKEISGENKNGK